MTPRCLPRLGYRSTRWLGLIVLGAGQSVAPRALSAQQATPAALAFRGVTVIEVTTGRRLPDQTVLVVGNRVQAFGPAAKVRLPKGTQLIEARDKYMIPGLWDMHAHVDARAAEAYPRYIANGITGIREMAQRFRHGSDSFQVWQREVRAGTRVGPRSIGPSTDLTSYVRPIKTEDDVRYVIDSVKAAGNLFVKFHGGLIISNSVPDSMHRKVFFALMRAARRVDLPVVGHSPVEGVTNVEAADSGLRSIEHTYFAHNQCWRVRDFDTPLPDSAVFEQACGPVVQAYIRNGTWLVPTLSFHVKRGKCTGMCGNPGPIDNPLRFWNRMHRLGVRKFLAGSDSPAGFPGRHELVLLVHAGLTPLEALQAGTLNPATFFGVTDSLGTVAPGKLADLVLLDADPLADITNVLKLWGVVANGRYFDRATLERMDPTAFEAVARCVQDSGLENQIKCFAAAPPVPR